MKELLSLGTQHLFFCKKCEENFLLEKNPIADPDSKTLALASACSNISQPNSFIEVTLVPRRRIFFGDFIQAFIQKIAVLINFDSISDRRNIRIVSLFFFLIIEKTLQKL